MANHKGSEGTVRVGAVTVAEIKGFSFDESANTIEDTELGDLWKTAQPGTQEWSGSIDVMWDETDATGQGALGLGSVVTLNLYPEGATAGDVYFSGLAIITARSIKNAIDGIVERSFSFKGTGALSQLTAV